MTDYARVLDFAERFSRDHPAVAISGDAYNLAGITVYHTATHRLEDKGRVEVNLITSQTPSSFEWVAEITIDNRDGGQFIHLIARRDQSIVETYGKTVYEISPARAKEIMRLLARLTA